MVDIQSEVSTAVAATLSAEPQGGSIANQVSTEVAIQVSVQVATQVAAAAAAASPVAPTPTPTEIPVSAATATATPVQVVIPSPTPQSQAPASASPTPAPAQAAAPAPTIWGEADTNCRVGPDMVYKVVGYLMEGASSQVYGQDASHEWWYIANPTNAKASAYCWVWSGSTRVEDGAADMPVVAAPSLTPSTKASNSYYNSCGYGCGGYNSGYYAGWYAGGYPNYCAPANCVKVKKQCRTHKVLICTKPNKCFYQTVRECGYTNPKCSGGCYSSCTVCNPYAKWPPPPSCKNNNPQNWWDYNIKWEQ